MIFSIYTSFIISYLNGFSRHQLRIALTKLAKNITKTGGFN